MPLFKTRDLNGKFIWYPDTRLFNEIWLCLFKITRFNPMFYLCCRNVSSVGGSARLHRHLHLLIVRLRSIAVLLWSRQLPVLQHLDRVYRDGHQIRTHRRHVRGSFFSVDLDFVCHKYSWTGQIYCDKSFFKILVETDVLNSCSSAGIIEILSKLLLIQRVLCSQDKF